MKHTLGVSLVIAIFGKATCKHRLCLIIRVNKKRLDIHQVFKLRGPDLNQQPSGYEPDELPDCSTPRYSVRTYFISRKLL